MRLQDNKSLLFVAAVIGITFIYYTYLSDSELFVNKKKHSKWKQIKEKSKKNEILPQLYAESSAKSI